MPCPDGVGRSRHPPGFRTASVAADLWPSRMGLLARSDPPRRLGWSARPNLRRCHGRHRKRWVAPATASVSGAAQPPRRPWCNHKPDNDIRSRRAARPDRNLAHMRSVSHVRSPHGPECPRLSATTLSRSSRALHSRRDPPSSWARAQAHPIPQTPRLEAREAAGGRVRRRVRRTRDRGRGGSQGRAAHAGEALFRETPPCFSTAGWPPQPAWP